MFSGCLLQHLGSSNESNFIDCITHIILDEVHERELDTDILLNIARDMLAVKKDLKIVLMSATIDANLFSTYFNGCKTVEIPGRMFNVDMLYLGDVLIQTNDNYHQLLRTLM